MCLSMRVAARIAIGCVLIASTSVVGAEEAETSLIEQGRRLYQDGILPNGEPLRAMRSEGFEIEGEYAACVTCHRHSGMGSVEGFIDSTVLVPPVAAPVLFAPARFASSYLDETHHYIPNQAWRRALTRPAYDEHSLARAMRAGIDPGGKQLLAPMPVYDLDDAAMAALVAYLQQLSSEPDPGVEPDTVHLATVITPDVRPGHAEAMLGVLQRWGQSARGVGKPWRVHIWHLSGPSTSWQQQLEANYRKQPVFALLSGVGASEWQPVHHFCEQRRLPCVLPSVEVVPDTGDDWYSMYFSPGVSLEARILARYFDDINAPDRDSNIIQLYSDASGRHAAELLRSQLKTDTSPVRLQRFRVTSPLTALKGLTASDSLVLWLRPHEIAQLVAALPQGPQAGHVFVSALLATPETLVLPPAWKTRLSYVSLFDDFGLQGEIARLRLQRWLELAGLAENENRLLQADAYAASYLFNDALGEIRGQEVRRPPVPLKREHVLESLETLVNKYNDSTDLVDPDGHIAYYGRMSLGPRQRIAVRGGTVVRYASPDSSKLVPVGKRIVP